MGGKVAEGADWGHLGQVQGLGVGRFMGQVGGLWDRLGGEGLCGLCARAGVGGEWILWEFEWRGYWVLGGERLSASWCDLGWGWEGLWDS